RFMARVCAGACGLIVPVLSVAAGAGGRVRFFRGWLGSHTLRGGMIAHRGRAACDRSRRVTPPVPTRSLSGNLRRATSVAPPPLQHLNLNEARRPPPAGGQPGGDADPLTGLPPTELGGPPRGVA